MLEIDWRSPAKLDRLHGGTLWALANSYLRCGRVDEAEQMARRSVAVYDSLKPLHVRGRPLAVLGRIAILRGDLDEAERLITEALDAYFDERIGKADIHLAMAELRTAQGDWDAAADNLRAALEIRVYFLKGDNDSNARIRRLLASALAAAGRADEALEVLALVETSP